MSRQVRKVIFLPACKEVLTDSDYLGPKYEKVYLPKFRNMAPIKRALYYLTFHSLKEDVLNSRNEWDFQGSIWRAIAQFKKYGYEVVLFPDHEPYPDADEFQTQLNSFIERNSPITFLNGNTANDFLQAIPQFNINPLNSILVLRDHQVIKECLENFLPFNCSSENNKLTEKKLGLNLINWDSSMQVPTNGYYLMPKSLLPSELNTLIKQGKRIYSAGAFHFMNDVIVYLEDEHDDTTNRFVRENYQWIQENLDSKGCHFVCFSMQSNDSKLIEFFAEYLRYFYPDRNPDLLNDFPINSKQFNAIDWNSVLLELLNLPDIKTPALLRGRGSIIGARPNEFSCIILDKAKPAKEQFELYFSSTQPAHSNAGTVFYRIADSSGETADDNFLENTKELSADIIQKIEYLKSNGMYSLLAEIALRIFEGDGHEVLTKLKQTNIPLELKSDIEHALSRLRIEWVNKFDFQITLPDYGNLVVEMPRLPKAVFYFFLQHPEGIMLNSLADYKEELLSIYKRVSNKSDENEIVENIERLTDPLDNSINVNCSRIKNAFVKLIDDRLAQNYYITGLRGNPKKIALPSGLIEII